MDGRTGGPGGAFLDEEPDERVGLREAASLEEGVNLFGAGGDPFHLGNARGS